MSEYLGTKRGTTHYNAHLGLSDKGRAIIGLVVYYACDLEPFGLLNIPLKCD